MSLAVSSSDDRRRSLSEQLRARRAEAMVTELESVALRLFEQRGFAAVTVDDIAGEAGISARTFYRYFPAKEDVLQVRLQRATAFLEVALARRPHDESPLRSVHAALEEQAGDEDPDLMRRWMSVISANPDVLSGVMGGIQLHLQRVIRLFFAERLGLSEDALEPWIWAAAIGGVMQGANIRWFLEGGDRARIMSEGFEILEKGIRGNDESVQRSGRGKRSNHTGRL